MTDPTDPLPLRIFIASPSDLTAERQVIRGVFAEREAPLDMNFSVVPVEGTQVRGTARRPQEAINELISECHFMFVLFKQQWGSNAGGPWGYTSGTEEELFTGLLERGLAGRPMRDVCVVFVENDKPAPEIVRLRKQIEDTSELKYEAVSNDDELRTLVRERLASWQESFGKKHPRLIELVPESGSDVLTAARKRIEGEKFIELGRPELGLRRLDESADIGGPTEKITYAKYLARRGLFDDADREVEKAIDLLLAVAHPLHSTLAAEAFATQAGFLRLQQKYVSAISKLEHALSLLSETDAYAQRVRCIILDSLGLAHQKSGEFASANDRFNQALEIRREIGDPTEVSQSLINLTRFNIRHWSLESAAELATEAGGLLASQPPSVLHANFGVLQAQILKRQGKPELGIVHAQRALDLNQEFGNHRGEAISHNVLAQCLQESGDQLGAQEHFRASNEINAGMKSSHDAVEGG